MKPEMLQYIHEGHQGKERCLLRARNTVFWPKMTYDIQQLIEKCIICQEYGKSQPIIGTTQELPPFPWHTFYWKRMDFLTVADVFSKYTIVRKLPNSTSAAVCIELSMIATELGLPHIIRSDNGPCYNSKEFQQFLQHYNITHQTSSPTHPRSNGFVKRMVRVAKKLMDKSWKRRETVDFRSVRLQSYTTVRQHCITIAITDTAHTQGEKPTSTPQHSRCPRNVPNSPGTHKEARE